MKRRRVAQRRRILKWVLTALSIIIMIVGAVSTRRVLGGFVRVQAGSRMIDVYVLFGRVCLATTEWQDPFARDGDTWGTYHDLPYPMPEVRWWLALHANSSPGFYKRLDYCMPLWIILLATALPAGLMWYRDWPRRSAWMCQRYGYDRRGLSPDPRGAAHIPCPECGTRPGADAVTPP